MRYPRAAVIATAWFLINAYSSALGADDPAVEMSLDSGGTWIPAMAPAPRTSPAYPEGRVLFRVRGSASFISLPICAASNGPAAIVWSTLGALGVQSHRLCTNVQAFDVVYARPLDFRPKWHFHLHAPDAAAVGEKRVQGREIDGDENGENGEKKEKKRGFLTKYGIYIALFVGISLFQGIREGNAQYMQQLEEERRLEEARKAGSSAAGTNIVVPRRKSNKEKRRKAGSTSAGKTK